MTIDELKDVPACNTAGKPTQASSVARWQQRLDIGCECRAARAVSRCAQADMRSNWQIESTILQPIDEASSRFKDELGRSS